MDSSSQLLRPLPSITALPDSLPVQPDVDIPPSLPPSCVTRVPLNTGSARCCYKYTSTLNLELNFINLEISVTRELDKMLSFKDVAWGEGDP